MFIEPGRGADAKTDVIERGRLVRGAGRKNELALGSVRRKAHLVTPGGREAPTAACPTFYVLVIIGGDADGTMAVEECRVFPS